MARRSVDWNKGLADDLKDPGFVREFIQSSLKDGLPIQVVLGKVVRAYGVKEFAAKIKMASPNLLRAVDPKHNPTVDTLNRLLKPFALEMSVAPRQSKNVA